MAKHTKIICTIGPASANPKILGRMIAAGMDVARLNFSHGKYPDHRQLITNIRLAAKQVGRTVAILQDLQGPRIRIGVIPGAGMEIKPGDEVVLVPEGTKKRFASHLKVLPTHFPELARQVKAGNRILISDGLIEIKVVKADRIKRFIYCTVVTGGKVTTHRGMNIPDVNLRAPVITDKDRDDLTFGLRQGVDWVALSFVRSADDISALRTMIAKHRPAMVPKIIAKIERQQAIDNLDEILTVTDAVMIARGDLGIELPPEQVPVLQKTIIQKCRQAGVPVIVATQMMESMMTNPRPTRAEVSDVANAVIDHADAVMLSGETATGKYPVETVTMMANTISRTEKSPFDDIVMSPIKHSSHVGSTSIATAVADLVQTMHVKAVFVMTVSGRAAQAISRLRPEAPVFAVTANETLLRQLALVWGIQGIKLATPASTATLVARIKKIARTQKMARDGEYILLVFGHPAQGLYALMPIIL